MHLISSNSCILCMQRNDILLAVCVDCVFLSNLTSNVYLTETLARAPLKDTSPRFPRYWNEAGGRFT